MKEGLGFTTDHTFLKRELILTNHSRIHDMQFTFENIEYYVHDVESARGGHVPVAFITTYIPHGSLIQRGCNTVTLDSELPIISFYREVI